MPMPAAEIIGAIRQALPDADVDITDLAGDNDHFAVSVRSHAFAGMSRVLQHRAVIDALKGKLGGDLHALSIKTEIKND